MTVNDNCENVKLSPIAHLKDSFSFPKKERSVSIIEYAEEQLEKFDSLPFNAVDSLILSQLAYMHLGDIVPGVEYQRHPVRIADLYRAELFENYFDDVRDAKSNRKLLNALCASPRYRDIKINYYINNIDAQLEKQFSAMTFFLPDGKIYIAFRGTDSTIVGWKEDFNLFFQPVIPGHISAQHYVQTVASRTDGEIYIGGHSKGGNLALYGATFAGEAVQQRITRIYNHDGPGLSPDILLMDGYTDLNAKVETTVPQASLFGLIFATDDFMVVKSDRMGIMQHDPFSWEICGNNFIYADKLKGGNSKVIFILYDLIKNLDPDAREVFIDTVFNVISAPGVTSFMDWPAMAVKEYDSMMETLKGIDSDTADKMKTVLLEIIKSIGKNILNLPDKEKIFDFIAEKVSSVTKKDKI